MNTRRTFLQSTAAVFTTNLFTGFIRGANDRISVAFIGVGIRGGDGLIRSFLPQTDCQCVAVCDTFHDRQEKRAKEIEDFYAARRNQSTFKAVDKYTDFRPLLDRKDIDAVVIATPDHWHVPLAIRAVKAGKDIYVEKPLGISINQDRALRAAVQQSGRVFQYGTQQRSTKHIRQGCELVRNGRIGKVHTVVVLAPNGSRGGDPANAPCPEGFDLQMWLGPGPARGYNQELHAKAGHYFTYNYSVGFLGGWGAHPLDVAQWGLGTDHTSPVEYEGCGFIPKVGLFTAIPNWTVQARYASGVTMQFMDDRANLTKFIGSEGWVAISRAALDAEPKSLLTSQMADNEIHLHESNNHAQDFLNSIRSRKQTVTGIECAVRSDAISQLSDIAIRTGRKIRWDPEHEKIIGDAEASRMLDRPLRAPWTLG